MPKSECIVSGCDKPTMRSNGKRCSEHLTTCVVPTCETPTLRTDGGNSGIRCSLHMGRNRRDQPMMAERRWIHGARYYKDANGYMVKRVRRNGRAVMVKEHREVMAAVLGRQLLPHENVHHKNGVKTDNRIENLELWVTKQPRGQRPVDLVAFAQEILEWYEEDVISGKLK